MKTITLLQRPPVQTLKCWCAVIRTRTAHFWSESLNPSSESPSRSESESESESPRFLKNRGEGGGESSNCCCSRTHHSIFLLGRMVGGDIAMVHGARHGTWCPPCYVWCKHDVGLALRQPPNCCRKLRY